MINIPAPPKALTDRMQIYACGELVEAGLQFKPEGISKWFFWHQVIALGLQAYAEQHGLPEKATATEIRVA